MRIFFIAGLGTLVLNFGLKSLFPRPRPELWHTLIEITGGQYYSFPSGHALGGTVLYGAIAYFLATAYPRWKRWIYGTTGVLVGAIAFSRLYLGVQWPSNAIAGCSIGFVWLTVCITMLRLQQLKNRTNMD